jgi:hypothetical protein
MMIGPSPLGELVWLLNRIGAFLKRMPLSKGSPPALFFKRREQNQLPMVDEKKNFFFFETQWEMYENYKKKSAKISQTTK